MLLIILCNLLVSCMALIPSWREPVNVIQEFANSGITDDNNAIDSNFDQSKIYEKVSDKEMG